MKELDKFTLASIVPHRLPEDPEIAFYLVHGLQLGEEVLDNLPHRSLADFSILHPSSGGCCAHIRLRRSEDLLLRLGTVPIPPTHLNDQSHFVGHRRFSWDIQVESTSQSYPPRP